jgi:hypothetical protein
MKSLEGCLEDCLEGCLEGCLVCPSHTYAGSSAS